MGILRAHLLCLLVVQPIVVLIFIIVPCLLFSPQTVTCGDKILSCFFSFSDFTGKFRTEIKNFRMQNVKEVGGANSRQISDVIFFYKTSGRISCQWMDSAFLRMRRWHDLLRLQSRHRFSGSVELLAKIKFRSEDHARLRSMSLPNGKMWEADLFLLVRFKYAEFCFSANASLVNAYCLII